MTTAPRATRRAGAWVTFTCLLILVVTPRVSLTQEPSLAEINEQANQLTDLSADARVRANAARALGRMGSEAAIAVPSLTKALKDSDPTVRVAAALALGDIASEADLVVPELLEALRREDPNSRIEGSREWHPTVRVNLVAALGQFGPAAFPAVPVLAQLLTEENEDIVLEASLSLGNIGPSAAAAVPGLAEIVAEGGLARNAALDALMKIGIDAKEAVPILRQRLKLEIARDAGEQYMAMTVVEALGRLSNVIADARALNMIGELRQVRDLVGTVPNLANTEGALAVRLALSILESTEEHWWTAFKKKADTWMRTHPLATLLAVVYLLWTVAWLFLFWLRPLALLKLNHVIKPYDIKLPTPFGGTIVPLRTLLGVGFLNYHRRVLDAWVKERVSIGRSRFLSKEAVRDREVHIDIPVELDGKVLSEFTTKEARPIFARQLGCLLITGEGGTGKTSLACLLAKLAMAEAKDRRLCEHLVLPVLIDQELDEQDGRTALNKAIGRQVQMLTDETEPIEDELLEQLLRKQRLLVIIDHVSEMKAFSRSQVRPSSKEFPVNALVITSRLEEDEILAGVSKNTLRPLRIAGNRLSSFMEAYFVRKGKRDLFDDVDFFEGCRRLSSMVGDRNTTVLLAKLYADQMITKAGSPGDKLLPNNIPDLMLSYLNELNRGIEDERLDNRSVHILAKALAWMCLKETFRPGAASVEEAVSELGGEDGERLFEYLRRRLRIIDRIAPSEEYFRFVLDPIAEYLGGLHLVEVWNNQEETWTRFLAEVGSKAGGPEAIRGFLVALRDCCAARRTQYGIPGFVIRELDRLTEVRRAESCTA